MYRPVVTAVLPLLAAAGVILTAAIPASAHQADGKAEHSPGVVSGNVIQAPIHVPVNACGNSINIVGLLNPTFGNKCVNE